MAGVPRKTVDPSTATAAATEARREIQTVGDQFDWAEYRFVVADMNARRIDRGTIHQQLE